MSWMCTTLLTLLTVLLALSLSPEADSAAVPSSKGTAKNPQGSLERIFMKQADASNFFRRRSRRGVKSQDELGVVAASSCYPYSGQPETISDLSGHATTLLPLQQEPRGSMELTPVYSSEQRQILAADERKKEFHEEKRNEFESYAEEDHDEQNERTRANTEQWREFHYDGMDPAYEYNRHST